MTQKYVDYVLDEKRIIPWMRGVWGKKWQHAFGFMTDLLVEAAHEGFQAGIIKLADTESLAEHGKACGIPRGYFETLESYRNRLLDRWNWHIWRGTKKGMIDSLSWAIAGIMGIERSACNIEIKQNWEWNRWMWTQTPANDHAPIWIIIRQPHPWGTSGPKWGDGALWGAGNHWGTSNGSAAISDLVTLIARLQTPAHARVVELIVILSGDIDPLTGEPTEGSEVFYFNGV